MKVFGREFENRFGFFYNDAAALEKRKKISVEELLGKKNLIVFTDDFTIRAIEKAENSWTDKIKIEDRTVVLFTRTITLKSFSYISGYSNFSDLKEDFGFKGETPVELMGEYVGFLENIGIRRNDIAMYGQSGIAEAFTYKGISQELFKFSNNNLPKTEKERKVVFRHYKEKLIGENGKVYGVLDCVPGWHKNVFKVDLNNYYGYLLCSQKYLTGNPYQVLEGKKEAEYEFLPYALRQKILQNYRLANRPGIPKGEKRFFKGANNLTLGRSENLNIYQRRTRTSSKGFLQPQHGFETIRRGAEILETYSEIFRQAGGTIVGRDTDAIWVEIDKEIGLKIIDFLNKQAIQTLKAAGLSEEEANCGIGQFKFEGYYQNFYQFADKAYCYQDFEGKIGITFAGLNRAEKKKIIEQAKSLEDVVKILKTKEIMKKKPLIINDKFRFL